MMRAPAARANWIAKLPTPPAPAWSSTDCRASSFAASCTACQASRAVIAKADAHAQDLAPIIARLDPYGSLSLRQLAAKLTAEGLPTARGGAVWTAAGIARVKARLAR